MSISPGRTSFYQDSVSELVKWLEEADTDPQLVHMIEEFLTGRGETKVAPLFSHNLPMYGFVANIMDELLGFDYFVERHILRSWLIFSLHITRVFPQCGLPKLG